MKMLGRRFGRRTVVGAGLWVVVVVLVLAAVPPGISRAAGLGPATTPPLTVAITISPPTVTQGVTVNITAHPSGGVPPYSYFWFNTPPGCSPKPTPTWFCTEHQSGQFMVNVTVTDHNGTEANASQTFTVTSNNGGSGGNGNGNGNGNGSKNGNNNSNGLNLSSFGPILVYGLIAGIVVFALLVTMTVALVMIAITLSRRLPRIPRHGVVCGSCQASAPPGAKYCPTCAAPLTPPPAK
jgi:hypothetical protein